MTHKFAICLYQPDMPQNLGVIIRTAACLEFPLHIIKPLPFSMTDKRFKGAVMDYIDHCEIINHENWDNFYLYLGNKTPGLSYPDLRDIRCRNLDIY